MKPLRTAQAWLLDRLGLTRESVQALDKPLPRGVGWLNTLGSAALFVIGLQFVTGILLMLHYTPVVGGAWESVLYIRNHVLFGQLIQGLHHYGASAAVIVVALHLVRVYLHAAYKPPRELLWVLGVCLFLIVLGLGFTGYLLPWDQKAYWATQVGTEIPGSTPVVGEATKRLLRGGEEIGQATLTRFYALHVAVLPLLLLLVVGAHVLLVWRKGSTSPGRRVGEEAPPASRFLQHQVFKDASVMLLVFAGIFALALLRPPHLELLADPSGTLDPTYQPLPDWYLLFLFQFLKDMGRLAPWLPEWIPATLLPGLAVGYLFLLPWLDRSPERRARKRPLFVGILAAGLLGAALLTARAYQEATPNITLADVAFGELTEAGKKEHDPEFLELAFRGAELLDQRLCLLCHQFRDEGGILGPELDLAGFRWSREWLTEKIRDPQSKLPEDQQSLMTAYDRDRLPDDELLAIIAALSQREGPSVEYRGLR